jgi:N-formylglutamate amidohydrolase
MNDPTFRGTVDSAVFAIREPEARTLPVVLASPHSGTFYPPELLAASRLDPLALRRSEDSFVDEIFGPAAGLGAPLIAARVARVYLDVNREAWELDPTMFCDALPRYINAGSPRVRMGLGTIPRIVASGEEIYAGKLRFAEAQRRVEAIYFPYHAALRKLVDDTATAFGHCLLLDCHSMPSATGGSAETADIVLGDCHGAACAPRIVAAARAFLAEAGFAVAINAPYAGGFTTDHYGRPRRHRHALQIEVNRALYMEEAGYARKPGLARVAEAMTGLVACLGRVAEECLGAGD